MVHYLEKLLEWEKNIEYFINKSKTMIVFKWLKKCPSCYSKNLQFVEGSKRFEKWFCRDCATMHYSYLCPHCKEKNWIFNSWKKHIYKEYSLGKYRGRRNFYRNNTQNYIKDQISFYKKGLKQWQEKLKEYKKNKNYKIKYGG